MAGLTVTPLGEDGDAWMVEGAQKDALFDALRAIETSEREAHAGIPGAGAYISDAATLALDANVEWRDDWWWAPEIGYAADGAVLLTVGDEPLPIPFPGFRVVL